MKQRIAILSIFLVTGALSISTIWAIQQRQRCKGTVDWCVARAKASGLKEVSIEPPLREYGALVDIDKVLSFCTIVKAHFISEIPIIRQDGRVIDTYRKYHVEVLHRASEPCATCDAPITIPKEVTPAEGEMVVPFEGGTLVIDGITVTMEPFEPAGPIGKAKDLVLVLFQNVGNPRFASLATGSQSAYVVRTVNGAEFLIVNDEPQDWYAHPLVGLFGPMQTKLSFSDFEKKLRAANDARKKT